MVSEPNNLQDQLIVSVSGYTRQASVCNVNHCHQLYPNSSLVCCHLHCCKCTDFHYIVRLLEFQLTGITVGIVQFCEWLCDRL